MRTTNPKRLPLIQTVIFLLGASVAASFAPTNAKAATLNASLGGTFTMNMDRDVLALSTNGSTSNPGHFLVHYYDTVESDYTTRSDSSFYFNNPLRTEIPAVNLVHDITPVSATDPAGQAPNRYVKSTTPDFAINSDNLTAMGVLGMTGIELYKGLYNGALIYGDYSLHYDLAGRQEVWDFLELPGAPSGWYLQNNVSFSAVVYELDNLSVVVTDNNNWKLSGDLLLSPANAGLIKNTVMADAGDFCLGTGSYSGCGQVSAVPIPAAAWLFGSSMAGLGLAGTRRRRKA